MGVRIIESRDGSMAAIYCSTSMWAFGPVFLGDDADADARAFLSWLPQDARKYTDNELERKYGEWLAMKRED